MRRETIWKVIKAAAEYAMAFLAVVGWALLFYTGLTITRLTCKEVVTPTFVWGTLFSLASCIIFVVVVKELPGGFWDRAVFVVAEPIARICSATGGVFFIRWFWRSFWAFLT